MKLSFCRSIALIVAILITAAIANADICVGDTFKVSQIAGRVVLVWRMGEQGIPKVLVELKEFRHNEWKTKRKTNTDENGRFQIPNVPSGTYRLDFTPTALEPYTAQIRLKKSRFVPTKEIVVTTGTDVHFCATGELRSVTPPV